MSQQCFSPTEVIPKELEHGFDEIAVMGTTDRDKQNAFGFTKYCDFSSLSKLIV